MSKKGKKQPLSRADEIRRKFRVFHRENPRVYRLFKRFAKEAIAAGHERFSADAVVHRIRWETNVVTRGDAFTINNDFVALYARKFMRQYPEYEGFFRTRALTSRRRPPRGES